LTTQPLALTCALEVRQLAFGKRLQNRRVDITLAAYRRRVAQLAGHLFHRLDQLLARLALGLPSPCAQVLQRQRTAGPGAVVLGGEIAPGQVAQVLVDVPRADRVALAVIVQVLEQLLSRQLQAAP